MVSPLDAAQVAARSAFLITTPAAVSVSGMNGCEFDIASQPVGEVPTAATAPDDLATVEQVAEAMKHSERTIRLWLRQRRLVGVRVGRRWLIRWRDLNAALAASRQGVPA